MRFREGMQGVTPILVALPPKESLSRPDGTHSGNPGVRQAVLEEKKPQVMAWAAERPGNGRGFGFTGGHDHWNWGDRNFRKLVLNAIVWCAHGDVPASGVESPTVTMKMLEQNMEPKNKPANFDREKVREKLKIPDEATGAVVPPNAARQVAAQIAAPATQRGAQEAPAGRVGGRGGAGGGPSRLGLLRNPSILQELQL